MALYFLTYDLAKSKNSHDLLTELQKLDAVRVLKSTWCFYSENTSAKALRDRFKGVVDSESSFLLSEINDWASFNLDVTPNDL